VKLNHVAAIGKRANLSLATNNAFGDNLLAIYKCRAILQCKLAERQRGHVHHGGKDGVLGVMQSSAIPGMVAAPKFLSTKWRSAFTANVFLVGPFLAIANEVCWRYRTTMCGHRRGSARSSKPDAHDVASYRDLGSNCWFPGPHLKEPRSAPTWLRAVRVNGQVGGGSRGC